jgi:hypothetical protein
MSDIFQNGKTCEKWTNLGTSYFKHRVLYEVRRKIFLNLGMRLEGREWEETLLYTMMSYSDLF